MLKSLALLLIAVLSGLCADLAVAQNYSGNSTSTHIASPQAKAEAKRLYKEGVKYGLAGLFSQAAEIFERAVKLDPRYADAHFALGHAYFDLQQWKKAAKSFERAAALNPRDQQATEFLSLARSLAFQGPPRVSSRSETEPKPETEQPKPETIEVSTTVKPAAPPPPAKSESSHEETAKANEANAAVANEVALTKIYRVGPSDVLDIRVNDSASPQSTLFTITSAGLLEHPLLVEPLHVGGQTVDEITATFESELKRRALSENPKVLISVRDYASHTILVSGLVKDSGTKVLRREAIPLYVVIADAQPLPEAARASVVRNESRETFEIDLAQTTEMNLLVRPGDVITVLPNVTQFVYVGGEVKLPGEKTYRRGLTLTQAIISAGGLTPQAKEARLGRDDGKGFLTVTRYKLKDIESGKVQDPLVKPGDRITIRN